MRRPQTTIALGLAAALWLATAPVLALEVEGVKFARHQNVGGTELTVNGAGMRNRALFRVYAMALYLPATTADIDTVLNGAGPKRIAVVPLLDLTAKQFADALRSGIDKNHDNDIIATLAERLNELAAALATTGDARKGTRIHIDWIPGVGTRLSVDGKRIGSEIAGEDFYQALLRIWLGRKPAQEDLRDALLGRTK